MEQLQLGYPDFHHPPNQPRPNRDSGPSAEETIDTRQNGEVVEYRNAMATIQRGDGEQCGEDIREECQNASSHAKHLAATSRKCRIAPPLSAARLDDLSRAMAEETIARSALLKYEPGEWTYVAAHRRYENARITMQHIQGQK